MDGFEADIAIYLTIDGQVFIAPQFDIKWEMNEGGTCPDFVALDFSCKDVVIVEVSAAANWRPLSKRVENRNQRWFDPVRRRLIEHQVITSDWRVRFLGFVRSADRTIEYITAKFSGYADVNFHPLEAAIVPWRYWDDRMANGLPGNRRSAICTAD